MKNLYLDKNDKSLCYGCGACAHRCPVNAIQMKLDEEGFRYPYLDNSKCV